MQKAYLVTLRHKSSRTTRRKILVVACSFQSASRVVETTILDSDEYKIYWEMESVKEVNLPLFIGIL